jgi:hypothetical protein
MYHSTPTSLLRDQVFNFILRSGAAGLTDEEISAGLHVNGDVLRPRRNELVLIGHVVNSGCRRTTQRGRTAIVWLNRKVAKKIGRI